MEMDEEGSVDRGGAANPEPGVEPGPIQPDTSVYVADVGPTAAAPPPPRSGNLTMYLGAALILLVGFTGGIFVQKRAAPSTNVTQGETGAGGEQGAGHAGGVGGDTQGAAGADSVFGRVTRVSGSTIYVSDEQGNVVKITTSTTSRFTKTSSAAIGDLRPGDNVIVQGRQGSGGTFAATVVTIGRVPGGFFGEGGPSNEASPSAGDSG